LKIAESAAHRLPPPEAAYQIVGAMRRHRNYSLLIIHCLKKAASRRLFPL
jgi:hypothetical protein